jgi:hypothetical protein
MVFTAHKNQQTDKNYDSHKFRLTFKSLPLFRTSVFQQISPYSALK